MPGSAISVAIGEHRVGASNTPVGVLSAPIRPAAAGAPHGSNPCLGCQTPCAAVTTSGVRPAKSDAGPPSALGVSAVAYCDRPAPGSADDADNRGRKCGFCEWPCQVSRTPNADERWRKPPESPAVRQWSATRGAFGEREVFGLSGDWRVLFVGVVSPLAIQFPMTPRVQ